MYFFGKLIYLICFREYEKDYEDAEKNREYLKKSTQAKFQKLTNKNQASDKLVCLYHNLFSKFWTDFSALLGSRIVRDC